MKISAFPTGAQNCFTFFLSAVKSNPSWKQLGPHGRIVIGLPERHLLVAGSLRPNDDEFASLFADFVLETSGGADEPVDRRVFELVGGRLVEFAGVAAH